MLNLKITLRHYEKLKLKTTTMLHSFSSFVVMFRVPVGPLGESHHFLEPLDQKGAVLSIHCFWRENYFKTVGGLGSVLGFLCLFDGYEVIRC